MPIIDNEVIADKNYPLDDIQKISVGKWLYNGIVENMEKYGDGPYMTDVSTGRSITFSELLRDIRKVASALWKKGLRPGDHVMVLAGNYIETAISFFAIFQCGAVYNALSLNLPSQDIRSRCDRTPPKFVITDPVRASRFLEAIKDVDSVQEVFVIGKHEGCTNYDTLLEDDGEAFPENPEIDLDSTPVVMYSSGTTGTAKAIIIDHLTWRKNHIFRIDGKNSLLNRKFFFINPMINPGGMQGLMFGVLWKMHLMIISDFSDDKFIEAIDKVKPDVISAFPTQLVWMCKKTDLNKYDLSSVKVFVCGGGCLNPKYEREIWSRLPNLVSLYIAYGMTEAGMITSNTSLVGGSLEQGGIDKHVFGSSGKLFANCRLKILDENGNKLGPRQEGHVVFKSPGLMTCYLDNPEATEETIQDSWCYSGDQGYYDEDGSIYITGRLKELIKYRMAHVVPANIERHLLAHPAVAEAVVIGIPDEIADQLPLACVVKRPGFEVTEQELIDMIAELVPDEERLRGGVLFLKQIPRNDWGKPVRRFLLETVLKSRCYS